MADASVTFETAVDPKGFQSGIKGVGASLNNMKKALFGVASATQAALGDKAQAKVDALTGRLAKQTAAVEQQERKVAGLRAEYEALASGEVEPKSLRTMEDSLYRMDNEVDKLSEKLQALQTKREVGGLSETEIGELDKLTARFDTLVDRSAELRSRVEEIKLDPSVSDEARKLADEIARGSASLEQMSATASDTESRLRQAMNPEPVKRINDEIRRTPRETNNATSAVERFGNRLKRLVAAAFVFNVIRRALSLLRNYIGGLLQTNADFVASLNSIKVNLAVAFQPIFDAILPALNAFMSALATVTAYLAAFISMLFGKTVSASKAATEALNKQSKALGGAGGAAEEASKHLASFDEINQSAADSSGGGGGGGSDIGMNFEELEEPDTTWLDNFTARLLELAELFKSGFWEGFFTANPEELLTQLGRVKTALGDLFTDPRIAEAASTFFDKLALNAGKVVGSLVSMGTSLATGLVGGFAKFLEDDKENIIGFIVDAFEVSGEILDVIGNTFVAIADVFSIFAGENAQTIVATVLGIFFDMFSGVAGLILRLVRDILDTVTAPFIQNVEKIKIALNGFLGFVASILGSIRKTTRAFTEGILRLYDEHIHPFIMSVKASFTEWYEHMLDGWNTYVQPVLDNFAEKFDEVVTSHVVPMIEKGVEFFGKLFDAIKLLWENLISPFVTYMVDAFAPFLSTAIETVGNIFNGFLSIASDVISSVLTALGGLIDFVVGVFTGDWELAWEGIKTFLITTFGDLILYLFELPTTMFEIALDFIGGFMRGVLDALLGFAEWALTNIVIPILQSLDSLPEKIKETGGDFIEGLWNGISDKIDWIVGKIQGFGDRILSSIKDFFGVKSPSTVFRDEVGQMLGLGLAEGITSTESEVQSSLISAISGAKDEGDTTLTAFEQQGSDVGLAMLTGMTSMQDAVHDAITYLMESTLLTVINVAPLIIEAFRSMYNMLLSHVEIFANSYQQSIHRMVSNVISSINAMNFAVGAPMLPYPAMPGFIAVPRLANGGLIPPNNPRMVVVGDNKEENEIIAPESTLRQIFTEAFEEAQAAVDFAAFANGGGSQGATTVVLEVNGREFGRASVELGDRERQRIGARIKPRGSFA